MTIKYNNVFIEDTYTICGNYENDGPLGKYFDKRYVKDLYFGLYCKTCRYYFMPANKRPCRDCIGEPLNQETHRPQKWETGI